MGVKYWGTIYVVVKYGIEKMYVFILIFIMVSFLEIHEYLLKICTFSVFH